MKTKKSVEHQVFIQGKGSSRPQHLEFNAHLHRLLWFACPSAAIAMFASSMYHDTSLTVVWELFLVPPLFRFHEIFATCDNDLAYKVRGFRGFYWSLYSKLVSGHRSVWSHSLLLGTPIRFCIGYWLPILLFVLGWNWETVYAMSRGVVDVTTGITMLTFPDFAVRFLGFWFVSCILADITHMTLDKYNPVQWLIGDN